MKNHNNFRILINNDEKAVGFRIMDDTGHIDAQVYEFIAPADMDEKGNILGCIEETLHTLLDDGWNAEEIHDILGLAKATDGEEDFVTYVDLDYVIPGSIVEIFYDADKFRRKIYERFKYDWLATHGYSIASLVEAVVSYAEESYGDFSGHSFEQLVEEWEGESGFNGTIYPCFEEFLCEEYLDPDYIKTLCWEHELITYKEDPYVDAEEVE